ncbi:MAG: ABC transporter substrate-binding protein [Dehalococcoidia bacterium]|jgi:ABC-type branched-subunit amino acid transport system substrate-binding protein
MKRNLVSIFMVAVFAIVIIASCAAPVVKEQAAPKILKIGSVMPFSGSASLWGLSIKPVLEIYKDLINSDGGWQIGDDNYTVELYYADGPIFSIPADASATRSLVYDNKVAAIVSYFGIGYSAVAPITTAEKVILNSSTISMGTFNAEKEPYSIFGFPAVEMSINQAMAVMQAFPQYKTLCWTGTEGGNVDIEKIYGPVDDAIQKKYGVKSIRLYYPEGTTNYTPYLTKMDQMGAQVLFSFGTPLEVGLMAKQRHELGYNWPIVQNAAVLDTNVVKGLAGSQEAMQNICGDYCYPWVLKKVQVAPRYLDMANRIRAEFKLKNGGKEPYAGAFGVGVVSMGQYLEGVQMAGTVDPDKVMSVMRGGTVETFLGKYTLSGQGAYGSPVVFGYPCSMSVIKGNENVYLNEEPMWDVDHPIADVSSLMAK